LVWRGSRLGTFLLVLRQWIRGCACARGPQAKSDFAGEAPLHQPPGTVGSVIGLNAQCGKRRERPTPTPMRRSSVSRACAWGPQAKMGFAGEAPLRKPPATVGSVMGLNAQCGKRRERPTPAPMRRFSVDRARLVRGLREVPEGAELPRLPVGARPQEAAGWLRQ